MNVYTVMECILVYLINNFTEVQFLWRLYFSISILCFFAYFHSTTFWRQKSCGVLFTILDYMSYFAGYILHQSQSSTILIKYIS